jgi:NTE family protein
MKYDTLILAGNSTNAVVTLGALQYLYDNGLMNNIKNYVGVSSGAILSTLLLIGYKPLELLTYLCVEKIFKKMIHFNISNILLLRKPLMTFDPIEKILEILITEKIGFVPTIKAAEELFCKKIVFTSYNLTDDKEEYITSEKYADMSIINGIRMSSTFPLIFEPFKYGGKLYLDGGLFNNFPLEYGENLTITKCIGIVTNNPQKKYSEEMSNIDYILKLFNIYKDSVTYDKMARSSKSDVIQLKFDNNFFKFDIDNKEIIRMFDNGYALCKDNIHQRLRNEKVKSPGPSIAGLHPKGKFWNNFAWSDPPQTFNLEADLLDVEEDEELFNLFNLFNCEEK